MFMQSPRNFHDYVIVFLIVSKVYIHNTGVVKPKAYEYIENQRIYLQINLFTENEPEAYAQEGAIIMKMFL